MFEHCATFSLRLLAKHFKLAFKLLSLASLSPSIALIKLHLVRDASLSLVSWIGSEMDASLSTEKNCLGMMDNEFLDKD